MHRCTFSWLKSNRHNWWPQMTLLSLNMRRHSQYDQYNEESNIISVNVSLNVQARTQEQWKSNKWLTCPMTSDRRVTLQIWGLLFFLMSPSKCKRRLEMNCQALESDLPWLSFPIACDGSIGVGVSSILSGPWQTSTPSFKSLALVGIKCSSALLNWGLYS